MGGPGWSFVASQRGLGFSTTVSQSLAVRAFTFGYELLGGTAPFSIDGAGDLISGKPGVTRPTIIGSDGKVSRAGVWRLVPGGAASLPGDQR